MEYSTESSQQSLREFPVNTQRRQNAVSTSQQRIDVGRCQQDVLTTMCVFLERHTVVHDLFTVADSNSFLSSWDFLPTAHVSKYLGILYGIRFYFIMKMDVVCTH